MVKKIANIDIDHIRASIPNDNIFLAYLVRRIIHSFSIPDNLYSEMSTFIDLGLLYFYFFDLYLFK